MLDGDEARKLIDSIDVSTIGRAARSGADRIVDLQLRPDLGRAAHGLEDYYPQGKRWWVRLHEKGGKQHEMPAHHLLENYMDEM